MNYHIIFKRKEYCLEKYLAEELYLGDNYDATLSSLISELENLNFDFSSSVLFAIDDKTTVEMKRGRFLYNLIMLKAYFKLGVEFEESDLITEEFNKDHFDNYIEGIIETFNTEEYIDDLKPIVLEIVENISDVTGLVNYIKGNTIDLFSIVELAKQNEKFNQLLHYKIDVEDSITDAEIKLKEATKELITILKSEENSLQPFLKAGVGIKEKQLRESILSVGYRPNLKGDIIETPVNSSFIQGIGSAQDYASCATGSRKALIINHINVKKSGYLTRKLLLLMVDSGFSHEEDCGTTHTIQVKVKSKFVLKNLHGRWYVDKDTNELVEIYKDDVHLIGKIVHLRSPISCASENGRVCKTCYGDTLYQVNKDKHPGILATLLLTNPFTQNLLSSKHMLRVDVDEVDWPDEVIEYFNITKDAIYVKTKEEDQNIPSFNLIIKKEDVRFNDSNTTFVNKFEIQMGRTSPIVIESKVPLYFHENLSDQIEERGWGKRIPSGKLIEGCFEFITENKEFSKSLDKITSVLDTNNHYIDSQNINKVYNFFISLLETNNISINLSHIEMIFKTLVRSAEDNSKSLDFSRDELEPYIILRVSMAILKSGSPALGLSFEKVMAQLKDPDFYELTKVSRLDRFFR